MPATKTRNGEAEHQHVLQQRGVREHAEQRKRDPADQQHGDDRQAQPAGDPQPDGGADQQQREPDDRSAPRRRSSAAIR
jgi:hypothetical protein